MKEWLTLIIVLLIIVIVFDGWRRMRNARYGKIRMSPSMKKRTKSKPEVYEEDEPREEPSYTSELPNGGARVVGHRDPLASAPSIEKKAAAKSYLEKQQRQPLAPVEPRRPLREPEQARLNLGESVPLLMEEIPDAAYGRDEKHERIEPTISASAPAAREDDYPADDYDDPHGTYEDEHYEDEPYEGEDYDEDDHAYEDELEYDRQQGRDVEDHNRDDDDYEYDEDDIEEEDSHTTQGAANKSQLHNEPEEVLIINIMAHKGEMLPGGRLLDAVLKCGMRYGDMDIFHRHSDGKGEGALLFSMANMVKPGTFDLDAMEDFETPGVSLFMTLPLDADSMQSFELMVETAKSIADALDGELKDEQRSVMTRQTIEHCRQRILDFERRRLFRRPR